MKNGKKLKIGGAHLTPRHIQELQASNLGDAQGIPFFINKNIRSCFSTLYFYCFICYVLFLECLCFCFQFSLVQFAVVLGQIPALFFGERHAPFSLTRTLQFHSYYSASVLFFLELPLVFILFRTFKFFFVVRCLQISGL